MQQRKGVFSFQRDKKLKLKNNNKQIFKCLSLRVTPYSSVIKNYFSKCSFNKPARNRRRVIINNEDIEEAILLLSLLI